MNTKKRRDALERLCARLNLYYQALLVAGATDPSPATFRAWARDVTLAVADYAQECDGTVPRPGPFAGTRVPDALPFDYFEEDHP